MTDLSPFEPPRIYPTLRCRDAEAMIRFLKEAFGFTGLVVYRGEDGIAQHAELAFGSSLLMLGQARDDAYGRQVGDLERQADGRALYRHPQPRPTARSRQGGRRDDSQRPARHHRLRQPRLLLPRPRGQSVELRNLMAKAQPGASDGPVDA